MRSEWSCLRMRRIWRIALTSKPLPFSSEKHVLDVVGERALLLLEALDPLDKLLELLGRDSALGDVLDHQAKASVER